jgi:polyhydroxybutyrate depolymerase
VPYRGGASWIAARGFPDVLTWTASWALRNRCAAADDARIADDVIRRSYAGCADDAAVVLYTVEGGGHQWFGGEPITPWLLGPSTDSIDATAMIWTFFREHPRRAREPRPHD